MSSVNINRIRVTIEVDVDPRKVSRSAFNALAKSMAAHLPATAGEVVYLATEVVPQSESILFNNRSNG